MLQIIWLVLDGNIVEIGEKFVERRKMAAAFADAPKKFPIPGL